MSKKAVDIINRILERNHGIAEITFAAYFYVPQSLTDKGLLKLHRISKPNREKIKHFIQLLLQKKRKRWSLGVTSRVLLKNGEFRHIPQIDFACVKSSTNLRRMIKCLRRFVKIKPGYILESGRSYHYYGARLLDQRQREIFVGNCLLCNPAGKKPIVDTRWFAYSLRRGFSNLRIAASDSKPEPKIVAKI